MAKLTRRTLITQTSVGVVGAAAIGGLAAVPKLAGATPATPSVTNQSLSALSGPLVVHVRDFKTGEIGVLWEEHEFIFHDRALVKRLLQTAGQAT